VTDLYAEQRLRELVAPQNVLNARAEMCRRNLSRFVRAGWEHIEPGVQYLHNWHIDAMAECLTALVNRQIKRLIINLPPRCMKSDFCSVLFPATA
jgi:hypothetical protein